MHSVGIEEKCKKNHLKECFIKASDYIKCKGEFQHFGPFHSMYWVNTICETYGFRPYFIAFKQNNTITATLPMIEKSIFPGKKAVIALPFTDECVPLTNSYDEFGQLFESICRVAHHKKWRTIEIRGGESFTAHTPKIKTFLGHRIELNKKEEDLHHNLSSSTKRNIRKANREGVEVSFHKDENAVSKFYKLMCITRKRHGLPPQPLKFYKNLGKNAFEDNNGFIALAQHKRNTVGAYFFLTENKHAVYKYGASDHRMQHLRVNDILMWESIRKLNEEGFSELLLGRTDINHEGLRRFKKGYGTKEYQINYYKYDFVSGKFVTGKKKKSIGYTRLLHKTPVWALRLIGNWIYKYAA